VSQRRAPRVSPSKACDGADGGHQIDAQASLFDDCANHVVDEPTRATAEPAPEDAQSPPPLGSAASKEAAAGREEAQGPPGGAASGGSRRLRRKRPNAAAEALEGHRSRLRARFDRGEELPDYELLELLLTRSLARQDTKPIAKKLVKRFGSLSGALAAPAGRLMEIDGVGQRVASDLRLVRRCAERFVRADLAARETLASTDAVVDYFRTTLRGAEREEFHVLFLDKKNGFLAAEKAQEGTVDHTPVYPREVLKRAIELGASAIVLVHNHPSGDPTPSRADVTMTARIVEAVAPVGITVHDHLVIGGNDYASLRASGLM
jgi:DNA repair protein RadC